MVNGRGTATETARKRRRGPSIRTARLRPIGLVTVLVMIGTWELLSHEVGRTTISGDESIPSVENVARAFPLLAHYWKGGLGVEATNVGGDVTTIGAFLGVGYNSLQTGERLLAGFLLGMVFGVGLAVAISWSSILRQILALPAHFLRMMPMLGMVPLFLLWFGNTARGAVIFIAFPTAIVFFVVTLNAINNLPEYYVNYAKSLGASAAQIYRGVVLPGILPQLRSGSLLALGFAWGAAIASELLGQPYGLGRVIIDASQFGRTGLMALVGIITVVFSAATFGAAAAIGTRITRWAE